MDKLGEEVSDKIKSAVRAKLTELGIHIDNELPDYVMVLVANKKSQEQMEEDLRLFLGDSTVNFTTWLYEILKKLERFTISSKGTKRKLDEKKSKHKKSSSESDNTSTSKKVKLKNENTSFGKMAESYFDSEDISNSNEGFDALAGRMEEKVRADNRQPKLTVYTDDEQMTAGDDDDAIQLHDNNEGDYIPDRPGSSLEEKLLPDAKHLLDFADKEDKYNGDKEDVKPRERIKICWDNNNAESKRKSDSKDDFNLTCNKNKNNNESKELEFNKSESNTKSSIRVNEFGDSESSVREKSEYIGSKIVDARDILKKKSSLSSKASRNESRVEKNRHSRRSRDKGSKENHSRCLSSVSKPVKREPEKPTVPSLVKVTPRPVRPPGMQPSCNLILKAVADAEKSIATTKFTQKKVQTRNEPKEKEKEKQFENYIRSRRENISITLVRVVSSDIEETVNKQKDVEEYEPTEPVEDIQREASPIPEIVDNKNESISSGSNGFQNLSSNDELQLQLPEPRFIITLDSTASDTEMEGELEVSVDNENCEKNGNKETLSVVRQPFDRSRLGPRLGPPVNDEIGSTRDCRLFTIDEGNDSSQEVEMETTEAPSENGKSQTRCKYWPCCDAGNTCPFYHPTMLCRLFPACHYGDKCLYIHPACKFADKCMNINCPFAHTSATPVIGKVFKTPLPLSTPNGQVCMYYPHCTKPFCPYLHIKKPCKFGSSCTKVGCEFEHPNKTITKNPYKWVANQ
uniref:Zinc finger CCCH domain-containing protein 14 n=1 Tax=Triatoma infestans TaxID=30076 RepID=A0A023EX33_TRIIF